MARQQSIYLGVAKLPRCRDVPLARLYNILIISSTSQSDVPTLMAKSQFCNTLLQLRATFRNSSYILICKPL